MSDTDTMVEVEKMLEDAEKFAQATIVLPTERGGSAPVSNLIHNGKVALPERMTAYRRLSGRRAELPTGDINKLMRKRYPDGSKVFVRTLEECARQPEPIEESCDICALREVKKVFYSQYDLEGHWDAFHPREWATKRREVERAEQREDRELMRRLVAQSAPVEAQVLVATETFACPICGKGTASAFGLQAHQRSHK